MRPVAAFSGTITTTVFPFIDADFSPVSFSVAPTANAEDGADSHAWSRLMERNAPACPQRQAK